MAGTRHAVHSVEPRPVKPRSSCHACSTSYVRTQYIHSAHVMIGIDRGSEFDIARSEARRSRNISEVLIRELYFRAV